MFGLPAEQVDPELRRRIKAMNYGLAYGLSAFGLSQQLRISPDEARGLMEDYFERFGGVRDYLREVVDEARQDGYTETILGRRRYLPDLTSDNGQRREMAERMALNAPIQGSAADIIKVAMLDVDGRAARQRPGRPGCCSRCTTSWSSRWPPASSKPLQDLVKTQMDGAYELRAPLQVSMGTGRTWQDAAIEIDPVAISHMLIAALWACARLGPSRPRSVRSMSVRVTPPGSSAGTIIGLPR